ncbi:MAG: alpha/beta fold hydrolase [Planctomycetota bacterium]
MKPVSLKFVHGFMGLPSDWDDVRIGLPEFDCGAVSIPAAEDWNSGIESLAQQGSDPEAARVWVGYSMGARISLGLAIECPNQCQGLVFISGNPGLENEDSANSRSIADEQVAQKLESTPTRLFLNDWYDQPVFESTPKSIRELAIRKKLDHKSSEWPAILRTYSVAKQPNYWHKINKLTIPLLVIAGARDQKYSGIANRIERLGSVSPISVQVVPECGHVIHLEKPDVVADLIRQFTRDNFG